MKKKCSNCGKELPIDSEFCQFCGSKNIQNIDDINTVKKPYKRCKDCGRELPFDSVFCQYCGSRNIEIIDESRKSFKRCIDCGKELPLDSDFCMFCGSKRVATINSNIKHKQKKQIKIKKPKKITVFIVLLLLPLLCLTYFEFIPHKCDDSLLLHNNKDYKRIANSPKHLIIIPDNEDVYIRIRNISNINMYEYSRLSYEAVITEDSTINLNYGKYEIMVAKGKNWIDKKLFFGIDTEYYYGTINFEDKYIYETFYLSNIINSFVKINYNEFKEKLF